MFQKMKKSKGFTLIEMLVVIAIIAVLVAIIVPVVGNSTTKAKAAADAANLRSMAATVAIEYLDDGKVTSVPSTPVCKSFTGNIAPSFAVVDGNVVAYFTYSGTNYGVDMFAEIATDGDTSDIDASAIVVDTSNGDITLPNG